MTKEKERKKSGNKKAGTAKVKRTEPKTRRIRNHKAVINKIVDNMTLMDDDLMSKVFDGNLPATQRLLRTVLGREDITVISAKGQVEYHSPVVGGRMIRLDVEAEDRTGVKSDIEVQRKKEGAHPRRARLHSSMLDSRMLKEGAKFKELKDSYTIFITEKDYFGDGLPIYTIERKIKENGRNFEDGAHIIYVNGCYDSDDSLGRLMRDFKCKNAKDMYYPELAEGVKHFKEEGGRGTMCEAVERYARLYAADRDAIIEELEAEKEKVEAEKEKERAEKEKVEAENARLREELARLRK